MNESDRKEVIEIVSGILKNSSSLRVSASVGVNLPITDDEKGRFNRITPNVSVEGVDPYGNVEAQLELADKASEKTWDKVSEMLERYIEKEIDVIVKKLLDIKKRNIGKTVRTE